MRRVMKERLLVAGIVLTAGAAAFAISFKSLRPGVVPQAKADGYATGGAFEPDNKGHWACFRDGGPLSSMPAPFIDFFWFDLDTGSSLTTHWQNSCDSLTDIVIDHDLVGSNLLGFYLCNGLNSSSECETATISINKNYYFQYFGNPTEMDCRLRHDYCHEIGHSLGLGHVVNSSSCLQSGDQNGCGPNTFKAPLGFYSAHHLSHINTDIN